MREAPLDDCFEAVAMCGIALLNFANSFVVGRGNAAADHH